MLISAFYGFFGGFFGFSGCFGRLFWLFRPRKSFSLHSGARKVLFKASRKSSALPEVSEWMTTKRGRLPKGVLPFAPIPGALGLGDLRAVPRHDNTHANAVARPVRPCGRRTRTRRTPRCARFFLRFFANFGLFFVIFCSHRGYYYNLYREVI